MRYLEPIRTIVYGLLLIIQITYAVSLLGGPMGDLGLILLVMALVTVAVFIPPGPKPKKKVPKKRKKK